MIDLSQLTEEQRWGLQFAVLTLNSTMPQPDQVTESQYAENVFRTACDSYYQQLIEYKKILAVNAFNSLTQEQQQALLDQLGVPNIVGGE